jgi:hypothetical protein
MYVQRHQIIGRSGAERNRHRVDITNAKYQSRWQHSSLRNQPFGCSRSQPRLTVEHCMGDLLIEF